MAISVNNSYKFGEFRLDPDDRTLWRGEELISLPPKVFEVLNFLVERSGVVISKADLMNAVWADTFVEEGNLTQSIYQLRRALGTDMNGQQFIETVPRRGYRFAIPVQFVTESQTDDFFETNSIVENHVERDRQINQDVAATNEQFLSLAAFRVQGKAIKAKTKYRWLLFGILGTAAIGLIGFRFYPVQSNKFVQSPIENVSIQKLTSSGESAYHVVSPDGKSIAYIEENGFYVQDVESEKRSRLDVPNANAFSYLKFSNDGESLYYRNQKSTALPGTVFRVSRFGGLPTPIFHNVWSAFSFSPDGKRAAFFRFDPAANQHALIIRDLDSGAERVLLTRQLPDSFHNGGEPAWSSDGKLLAVITTSPHSPVSQMVVAEVEKEVNQVVKSSRVIGISHLAWMPDGKSLIVSAREKDKFYQLWRIGFPDGEMNRLTNDLNAYFGGSLSADGKRLVASQYSNFSHIWTAPADRLEEQRQITFGNQNKDGVNGINWTSDGNIVYATRAPHDLDLWMVRPHDGSKLRLTQNAGVANVNPVIGQNGKYLYFNSTRNRGSHIWRMDINGENPTQLTFSETETEYFPNISPDDNWLYYVQRGPQSSGVWRKSMSDGTAALRLTPETVAPSNFLSLSPDGKLLTFHNLTKTIEEEAGAQIFQIGVVSAESPNEPRFYNIRANRLNVRWSPDSKNFDYIGIVNGVAGLWRQSLDADVSPVPLLLSPSYAISNFAWSPDGKQLAIARGADQNDAVMLTNF